LSRFAWNGEFGFGYSSHGRSTIWWSLSMRVSISTQYIWSFVPSVSVKPMRLAFMSAYFLPTLTW
jgi:hypothetical protein